MAVQEQTPYIEYECNGITKGFPLGFYCDDSEHLIVKLDDVDSPASDWTLNNESVVFRTAPKVKSKLSIQRDTPLERVIEYNSYDNSMRPQVFNHDFDRVWWKLQELGISDWLLSLRLDKEVQDRILADLALKADYILRDSILKEDYISRDKALEKDYIQRDAQLKKYIDSMIALITGDPSFDGVDASMVFDESGLTQQDINDNSIRTVESIEDLLKIKNPKDGDVVHLKSFHKDVAGGGGNLKFDSRSEDNGVTIFKGWVREDKSYVTLRDGGVRVYGDGVGSWSEFNKVLRHGFENNVRVDGEGLIYLAAAQYFDSNLYLSNVTLINGSLDKNMHSVLTTDENPEGWLENVTFENVFIDGKRELCTGLPSGGFDEDGGRHGIRIVKKVNGLRFINTQAVNCCIDGVMIYPKNIPSGNRIGLVKNVYFEGDCRFNGNGRWGVSSDSTDTMVFGDGFQAKGNGLDIIKGADITSGLSSRKHEGFDYGGGVDIEEYSGESFSKNIHFGVVDLRENAAASVNFTRTGILETSTHTVFFGDGGMYSAGVSDNQNPAYSGFSIVIGGYTMHNQDHLGYREFNFGNIDCSGGMIYLLGVDNSQFNSFTNSASIDLNKSVVRSLLNQPFSVKDSMSNYYINKALEDKSAVWIGSNPTKAMLHSSPEYESGYFTHYDGKLQGGIGFINTEYGYSLHFYSGGYSQLLMGQYGSLIPTKDNIAALGTAADRFSRIFLSESPIVTSDERLKQQFRTQSEREKDAALEIKKSICLYKFNDSVELKGDGARWHVGVKAQQVIRVMRKHDLNPFDYAFICHDEWEVVEAESTYVGNRFAIRYDELAMFILSSL